MLPGQLRYTNHVYTSHGQSATVFLAFGATCCFHWRKILTGQPFRRVIEVVFFLMLARYGWSADPVKPGPPDDDAPEAFETTKSGLKYRILRKSDGKKPNATSTVKVHYRGWLPDPKDPSRGKEFDSSYERGEPISFPLDRVIPGWTEGMQLVGEGGMIELEVPPSLGYGKSGVGDVIPANATLRFLVELLAPPQPGPRDDDAPKDFTETKTGLKYRVLRKGKGAKPKSEDEVVVHYRGWIPEPENPEEGQEFDSSYSRGEPISFPLNGVIAGWTEGMQLVEEGGMIELEVPAKLGYGARGAGPIPPNATLRFIVELLKVR